MNRTSIHEQADEEQVEQLSRDYNKWKALKFRATGLYVDPATGCIDATDDWWAVAGGGKFKMRKFRAIIARDEDMLEVVFGNTTTMSECTFVSGVDDIDLDTEDLGENQGGDASTMHSPMQSTGSGATACSSGTKRPCAAPLYPSNSRPGKRSEHYMQMKRLVDLCERSLTVSSRMFGSSVTSPEQHSTREDLLRLVKMVKEAGAAEGSNEHCHAS